MKMEKVLLAKSLFKTVTNGCNYRSRRYILSQAYYCNDIWTARLQNPVLSKIIPDEFGAKVFQKFEADGTACAIDMDLMANTFTEASPEMQSFILKMFPRHRKTKEALDVIGSTPYGLLRSLLEMKKYQVMLDIINSKSKFGIFPDDFTACMIMDHFIKQKDYTKAAMIAYDIMLQEDTDAHPISKALLWHACHHHWKNQTYEAPVLPEEDEDEEVKYIRVDFVTKPYYDDHFDIPHEAWKLGKTFQMLTEGRKDTMNLSYHLIGLALHDKYEKAINLLTSVLESSDQSLAPEALQTLEKRLEAVEAKEPKEEKDVGLQTFYDYLPFITQEQKDKFLEQIKELKEKLAAASKISQDFNLEESLDAYVKNIIAANESKDIECHRKLLKEWEEQRRAMLDEQIVLVKKQMRIKELGEQLREIQLKEDKLRFYQDARSREKATKKVPKLYLEKVKKQYHQGRFKSQ